jgi:hypothetical protein
VVSWNTTIIGNTITARRNRKRQRCKQRDNEAVREKKRQQTETNVPKQRRNANTTDLMDLMTSFKTIPTHFKYGSIFTP